MIWPPVAPVPAAVVEAVARLGGGLLPWVRGGSPGGGTGASWWSG